MIAMDYFPYIDRITHLCDINNLPEERFSELYKFIRNNNEASASFEIVLESMANFKSRLDKINMDLASMGLLKKVTYEEL